MCVLFLAFRPGPDRRLIVAANRDEFRARPAAAIAPWPERADVIGGRDLVEHGSWLAVRADGRFAAVTNFRRPPLTAGARSRGALVRDAILSDAPLDELVDAFWRTRDTFGGFHLVLGDGDRLVHLSNREPAPRELGPGVHAVSNGPIDDRWPKMRRGDEPLTHALDAEVVDEDALFDLLSDHTPAPDDALPDTGVGLELERALSPVFITGEAYGTRASTVVTLGRQGLRVRERTFGAAGQTGETVIER